MYTEHRNHFFTLLFITVVMVQCKAVFIKLLTTVNNLLTAVDLWINMLIVLSARKKNAWKLTLCSLLKIPQLLEFMCITLLAKADHVK